MKKPPFSYDVEFWVLVGIFMIFWAMLNSIIFGIWANKRIEQWKEKNEIISDLKIQFNDRRTNFSK